MQEKSGAFQSVFTTTKLMELEMRWQPLAEGVGNLGEEGAGRKLLSIGRHNDGSILHKWVRNETEVGSVWGRAEGRGGEVLRGVSERDD